MVARIASGANRGQNDRQTKAKLEYMYGTDTWWLKLDTVLQNPASTFCCVLK